MYREHTHTQCICSTVSYALHSASPSSAPTTDRECAARAYRQAQRLVSYRLKTGINLKERTAHPRGQLLQAAGKATLILLRFIIFALDRKPDKFSQGGDTKSYCEIISVGDAAAVQYTQENLGTTTCIAHVQNARALEWPSLYVRMMHTRDRGVLLLLLNRL